MAYKFTQFWTPWWKKGFATVLSIGADREMVGDAGGPSRAQEGGNLEKEK
jgi:hypothetical protein